MKIRYQILGRNIKVDVVTPSVSPISSVSTISLGSTPPLSCQSPQERLAEILAAGGLILPKVEPPTEPPADAPPAGPDAASGPPAAPPAAPQNDPQADAVDEYETITLDSTIGTNSSENCDDSVEILN